MDPQRLDRLLRIFVLLGMALPSTPYALGFPHDNRYCFDIRVGGDVCALVGGGLLVVAFLARCATYRWMTPVQSRWFLPTVLGAVCVWFLLPAAPWPYWTWSALSLR